MPGVTDLTQDAKLGFVDRDLGFAVRDASIYRTTDGALSWSPVATADTKLRELYFPARETGYAYSGDGATLLRTTDGGSTWERRPLHGASADALLAISCAGPDTCLIASGPELLLTEDGGATARPVPDISGATALDRPAPDRVIVLGPFGVVRTSVDGGQSFTSMGGVAGDWGGVRAVSGGTVDAFSYNDIARSRDGGRSWTPLADPLPAKASIGDLSFSSEDAGVLAAVRPGRTWRQSRLRLYATSDAGANWRLVHRDEDRRLNAILALTRKGLLAAGTRGLLRSRDGGATLRVIRDGAVRRAAFTGLDRAGAAVVAWGPQAIALAGRRSSGWTRIATPSPRPLRSVDFVDARSGFAAAGRALYRTTDGGRSWRRLISIGDHVPRRLAFADRKHGFVDVSVPPDHGPDDDAEWGFGIVLRTDDGGATWSPQPLIFATPLTDLVALDERRAVAAVGGPLLFTDTGGRDRARPA